MADFDPYLKWLGIRDATRPINHYRLLGLDLFESDPEVISMAADRQMAHVRTYQNGPHGELSQELLNELARARRCLLTPDKKAAYDQQLQEQPPAAAIPVAKAVSPAAEPVVAVASGVQVQSDTRARAKSNKREQKELAWTLISWVSGGLAALGLAAWLIGSGYLPMGQTEPPQVAQNEPDVDPETMNSPPPVIDDPQPGEDPPMQPSPDPPQAPQPGEENGEDGPTTPQPDPGQPLRPDDVPPAKPIRGPILPASTQWTLGNSSTYPKPDVATLALLEAQSQTPASERSRTPASNPIDAQTPVEDQPEPAGLLIGFRVWAQDDSTLAGIQPIYLRADGLIAGSRLGTDSPHYTDVIADPGFAVGAVQVSVLDPVHSVLVHFDRISEKGLDSTDRYSSPWIGKRLGPVQTFPCPPGEIFVGCHGGTREHLVSLGLIRSGSGETELAMTKPEVDPFAVDTPGLTNDPAMANADSMPGKPAVPSEEDYRRALPDFLQPFENDLTRAAQARNADLRQVLLSNLAPRLENAADRAVDPVERYVGWHQTTRLYAQVGNARSAISALEQINQEFEIDFWLEVDNVLAQTLPNLSDRARQTPQDFMSTVDRLIQQALDEQEYAAAERLIGGVLTLANQTADAALRARYQQRLEDVEELAQLHEEHAEAELTLATNSEDPKAHSVVGDYLLVMETGELDAVLDHWARGSVTSQASLAKLAAETDASDGEAVLKLAKAWHRLGKGKRSLKKQRALKIARDLYADAADLVDERTREKIEETILEVEAAIDP